ncbi:MAG TPA: ABC transporter ATP-binding protein [Spirochaetia bacterium]|nr:ABC transporter ATP-binding protein [Spirochaetia bacterium]
MVEIRGMSFGYGRKKLFSGLDLELKPGNIYGLLGKNGAGKTTLLKLICGLRIAQEGTCRVLGFDPSARPAPMLEDICFIAEELAVPALLPRMYESLHAPFYPRFDHEALASYLGEFEIPTDKKLSELSYGQKKKFLIAFGLASRCRLLLMDEPSNGLDIPSKSQFRRLLARAGGTDQVILVSTHQVRDMENLIDPIIILDEGRIIFSQAMSAVGARLRAGIEPTEPADDRVLYAEKTLGGYAVLRESAGGEETTVDLETLFNAVTAPGSKVRSAFERAAAGAEASGSAPEGGAR